MIKGASVNVLDFGADPTGAASSVTAFNNALANGGSVHVPQGTYTLDGKVSLTVDNSALYLAADVTLNVSGVAALQSPFGAQILIGANNCAVIGSGPSSLIQNVLGTYANTITLIPGYSKVLIRDLTLDGGKDLVTATTSDTFGSGVMIIGYTPQTAVDVEATIDNLTIRNYSHYGVSMYGNQTNGVKVTNCNIRDIGIADQALSVGAGIVSAISGSNLTIANNTIKNCKQNGIFVSSAGTSCGNHVVANNVVLTCGGSGIAYLEQPTYFSSAGNGVSKIVIAGNNCIENTRSGIQINVDTVGFIRQLAITGNVCNANTYGGIEINSTNTAPSIVSEVKVSGNQTINNGTLQTFAGPYVDLVEGIERSFVPVIEGTSSPGVGTYGSNIGSFVKDGLLVHFQTTIDWSAHTGTGNIKVANFPYPASAAGTLYVVWVWASGLTITGQAQLTMTASQTYGTLGSIENGAYEDVAMDTAGTLRISGTYIAAA